MSKLVLEVECDQCNGTGDEPGSNYTLCYNCYGDGKILTDDGEILKKFLIKFIPGILKDILGR